MSSRGANSGTMTEAEMAQRLQEAELEAVSETNEQVKKLEEIREEYVNLKGTLKRLPEELTHDVMVPFGKKAFMPGKLVHTNEILVLLGENWFVETSSSRASEIADRRLTRLDEMISQTKKQRDMFQSRSSFTKDVVGTLRSEGDEEEIREEYDANEFAAINEKKRLRAAQAPAQSRDELMAKARRAMVRCEQEEEEQDPFQQRSSFGNKSHNNPASQTNPPKSSLKHNALNAIPISEEDWVKRLERETKNDELNKIADTDDETRKRIEREVYNMVYEDDEEYDFDELTDDDDGDDEDDDEDVPIVPFGNLGKTQPVVEVVKNGKEEQDEEEDEEDVPIVSFGNLGKTKPKVETTPPNAVRFVSTTGSDATDDDTPRTRERKRLTWASGVEDNDVEKCDAFGSRLKALFNTYKDEEIVVSDEEEEEEGEENYGHKPVVTVETARIIITHTPSDLIDKDLDGSGDKPSPSAKSPRHPGEIQSDGHVSNASLTLLKSDSKTTFKEIGEKGRNICFADSPKDSDETVDTESQRSTTSPFSNPSSAAEPKSILKKSRRNVSARFRIADEEGHSSSSCDEEIPKQPGKGGVAAKTTAVAVAEEIKEREPIPLAMVENISISTKRGTDEINQSIGVNSLADPPKRVSKFKQQRQNQTLHN